MTRLAIDRKTDHPTALTGKLAGFLVIVGGLSCSSSQMEEPVILQAPSNLSVLVETPRRVTLSWSDESTNEEGNNILLSAMGSSSELVGTTEPDTQSYTLVDLQPEVPYRAEVGPTFLDREGPKADVEFETPSLAPNDLEAIEIRSDSILLAWTDRANRETGYELEGRQRNEAFELIDILPADTTQWRVNDLVQDTNYDFRLRAISAQRWESSYSEILSVRTIFPDGPGIQSVYPSTGSRGGGTPIIVRGFGFAGQGLTVELGGRLAQRIIVVDDRHLSFVSPPSDRGGPASLTIRADGIDAQRNGAFFYGVSNPNELTVDIQGNPTITFDDTIGVTTVGSTFVVRTPDGTPVPETDVEVQLFLIDGSDEAEIGVDPRYIEGLIDARSELLEQDLFLYLTLDASFSLIQNFDPPQFIPMLEQAQSILRRGQALWGDDQREPDDPDLPDDRFGRLFWDTVWFRALLERTEAPMTLDEIADIPDPLVAVSGDETLLYAGLSHQVERSGDEAERDDGRATGPRDRHVVILFTDGEDTLSFFDNPDVRQDGMLETGAATRQFGWRATELEDVLQEIVRHPLYPERFTILAVGLGNARQKPLLDIAQVGLGRALFEERDIVRLFEGISAEFTEQLTRGATMALRPKEYRFQIRVRQQSTGLTGEGSFTFTGGTMAATLISVP